ncbi:MAG: energy-coupling factor ABC transporter ATP-binding protein [Oscillospiraceae bacterium]|nr:energy-coupling factor ABC transporter ATP-binding protein [Oscillospiraceae bacterium]
MDERFTLELRDISFSYPARERRQNFSLAVKHFVPSGQCTAIMGENGSGKTTLGKLAAGLLRPDAGCVLYDGEDIAGWKLGQIGRQVGYLFQEPSRQLFTPRPLEELSFAQKLRGVPQDEAEDKATELLRQFELEHIKDNTTYTLSRGEKQRLAIAAAMVAQPRFFVLDEPTTGLDKRRRGILAETLHSLMSKNVGILLISHDCAFVDEMQADIRIMDGGGLVDA